jgi:hypothetical protein
MDASFYEILFLNGTTSRFTITYRTQFHKQHGTWLTEWRHAGFRSWGTRINIDYYLCMSIVIKMHKLCLRNISVLVQASNDFCAFNCDLMYVKYNPISDIFKYFFHLELMHFQNKDIIDKRGALKRKQTTAFRYFYSFSYMLWRKERRDGLFERLSGKWLVCLYSVENSSWVCCAVARCTER